MENKLPEGWEWKKLGDIGEICSGGTPSTRDETNFDGDIPWITPADLSNFEGIYIEKGKRNISEKGLSGSSAKVLPKNSVIFSSRAPIGYVAIASNPLTTNQGFKNIILKEQILPEYVYYYLKKSKRLAESYASGTTFLEVSATRFSQIPIIIPPLETQKKIVSILEKAEETKKLRAKADELTQKLLQSVFLEMFGDPVINPMGWDKKKIGNISTHVSSGSTPKGGKEVYQKEGTLFIRSQNVHMNRLVYEDIAYISREIHNSMRRTWVQKGDVLLNITGASIGRVAWYSGNNNEANVNQHVCIIRPKQSIVKPEFLSYQISMESYQNKTLSQQSGATRQAFNYSQIKDFDSIVPSVDLQQNFVSIIGKIEEIKKSQQQSSLEINNLFDALMQKAFTGELVA